MKRKLWNLQHIFSPQIIPSQGIAHGIYLESTEEKMFKIRIHLYSEIMRIANFQQLGRTPKVVLDLEWQL